MGASKIMEKIILEKNHTKRKAYISKLSNFVQNEQAKNSLATAGVRYDDLSPMELTHFYEFLERSEDSDDEVIETRHSCCNLM